MSDLFNRLFRFKGMYHFKSTSIDSFSFTVFAIYSTIFNCVVPPVRVWDIVLYLVIRYTCRRLLTALCHARSIYVSVFLFVPVCLTGLQKGPNCLKRCANICQIFLNNYKKYFLTITRNIF
jgi:hypothetical protein